jgi:hypothetical protein
MRLKQNTIIAVHVIDTLFNEGVWTEVDDPDKYIKAVPWVAFEVEDGTNRGDVTGELSDDRDTSDIVSEEPVQEVSKRRGRPPKAE